MYAGWKAIIEMYGCRIAGPGFGSNGTSKAEPQGPKASENINWSRYPVAGVKPNE